MPLSHLGIVEGERTSMRSATTVSIPSILLECSELILAPRFHRVMLLRSTPKASAIAESLANTDRATRNLYFLMAARWEAFARLIDFGNAAGRRMPVAIETLTVGLLNKYVE